MQNCFPYSKGTIEYYLLSSSNNNKQNPELIWANLLNTKAKITNSFLRQQQQWSEQESGRERNLDRCIVGAVLLERAYTALMLGLSAKKIIVIIIVYVLQRHS